MPRVFSSFTCLNITQLLTALNDNLYKLLLVFFLISIRGETHTNTILALAGVIFVIPFLLFASLAGSLADRYSKQFIIFLSRITEMITMTFGVIAFYLNSAIGAYCVLFFMAVQSTIFSPCKYGIIPEIVDKHKISHCNGVIAATTYLAIIIGTFLASFLTEITHKNFVAAGFACILVAVLGLMSSLGIEKTQPQAVKKKISTHFISDIFRALMKAKKQRYLMITMIFGAYFLFVGAYTQLNIIPFSLQSLHLTDVQGGYLFLMTAIGIGIGSYFAGTLSGKEVELGFLPMAAFGIGLCFIGLYFFSTHFFISVPLLILMGICGGFYIVPVDAFIQITSPDSDRGQNVATSNFLSFVGVIIASGLIAFLGITLKMTAAQGFLTVGTITVIMAMALLFLYADQVLRLLVATFAHTFWKISIIGKERIKQGHATLMVAPRTSWVDTLIIMSIISRRIRYIVPLKNKKQKTRRLYHLLKLIPIDIDHFTPIGTETLEAIRKELASGNSVCLMQPVALPLKNLRDWEGKLAKLLLDIAVPVMPIHISKQNGEKTDGHVSELLDLHKNAIKVSFGIHQKA